MRNDDGDDDGGEEGGGEGGRGTDHFRHPRGRRSVCLRPIIYFDSANRNESRSLETGQEFNNGG